MSDNKSKEGKKDATRIDSKDPSEVEYLHRQYPSKSHQEIKDVIAKYGPMRAKIVRHLSK